MVLGVLRPRFPLSGVFRVGRVDEIWWKRSVSAVIALGAPYLVLLALGRLDLAMYVSAGAMCALYTHALPYPRRARVLAWIGLAMTATVGAAAVAASLTDSAVVLVVVAALLAAVHKLFGEAAKIGAPGNVILTFIGAAVAFVPTETGQIPGHTALAALGALIAWAVVMAPALVRPYGPERRAVAAALEAAAQITDAPSRHRAAAAVNAAWRAVLAARPSGLDRLLVQAEEALSKAPETARLNSLARRLRAGTVPEVGLSDAQVAELTGLAAERHTAVPRSVLLQGLWPVVLRVLVSAVLGGWISLLLGVGHPYWAVVTAAAVCQASADLSWRRALQRAWGNFAGLAVFALLLPISRTGAVALVLLILACQFVTEGMITRNYWLGTVFVTPMALLMTEFAAQEPGGVLVLDRALDTVVGVVTGLVACLLVTNHRAARRTESALERVDQARAHAAEAEPAPAAAELASALVGLREAADIAHGEWWRGGLPEERIVVAEREGHRELAALQSGGRPE
ncbi:fusaric acid resistance family protein [Actinocorallia herbida]|uniref:Fusaric acid resistance family protein n=1 Tax=Actinocorallia herbida TaxID=58109 RepID=A0A3N1D6X9_9ACTN|nr:FUSC family protein [Actinocorallia herbida]ROO88868.1 fusaric acid resistance family protein [Actinocorallia herbida]